MKASELRSKGVTELKDELKALLRAQFSLRMQLSTQQTNKTHELRSRPRPAWPANDDDDDDRTAKY